MSHATIRKAVARPWPAVCAILLHLAAGSTGIAQAGSSPDAPAREQLIQRALQRLEAQRQQTAQHRAAVADAQRRGVENMVAASSFSNPMRALLASSGSATAASGCPRSLGHLESRLPRYDDPDLEMLRNAVLATDFGDALASARAMGYTPSQAARLAVQQAQAADESLVSAEACVRGFAVDPDRVFEQLRNGTFQFGTGAITADCAKGYVMAHYQAVANREAAIGMACLARSQ